MTNFPPLPAVPVPGNKRRNYYRVEQGLLGEFGYLLYGRKLYSEPIEARIYCSPHNAQVMRVELLVYVPCSYKYRRLYMCLYVDHMIFDQMMHSKSYDNDYQNNVWKRIGEHMFETIERMETMYSDPCDDWSAPFAEDLTQWRLNEAWTNFEKESQQ